MSRLLICGSDRHTETRHFRGLTVLLWDCKSVYQPGPSETVVVSLAVYIRFLGVRPVSWQGYRWWITSLSYSSTPPGYMLLLFLLSNSTSPFFSSSSLFYNQHFYLFVPSPLPRFYFHLSLVTHFVKQFSADCVDYLIFLKTVLEIKALACLSLDLVSPSWGFPTITISPHSDLRDSLMLVFG